MKKLGHGAYVHKYNSEGSSVLVTFGKNADKQIDGDKYTSGNGTAKPESGKYFSRGKDDKRLLQMHKLVTESPNKWQLLETKASFIAGLGISLFERTVENNRMVLKPAFDSAFDAWLEDLDISTYVEQGSMQLAFSSEINARMVLDTKTKKPIALDVIENNELRAEVPVATASKLNSFWISNQFGHKKWVNKKDCLVIPAFDKAKPEKHAASLIHLLGGKPMQKIYGWAGWWGTEAWTNVANGVPKFYAAAFRNGFFVTHHISFPESYFDKWGMDEKETEVLKEKTLASITDVLSSVEESNKVLITFHRASYDRGGVLNEVKITPMPNPIKDDSFIKMFEAANLAQASGHGVPAKLAGVQIGSVMGSSGKEIAAEAAYLQDYLTFFDRERLVKPVRIAAKLQGGWEKYHIGIQRIDSYVQGSTAEDNVSHPNNN